MHGHRNSSTVSTFLQTDLAECDAGHVKLAASSPVSCSYKGLANLPCYERGVEPGNSISIMLPGLYLVAGGVTGEQEVPLEVGP